MTYNLEVLDWQDAPKDWFGFGRAIVANLPDFDPQEGLHVIVRTCQTSGQEPVMLAPASPTGIATPSGWASSDNEKEWPVLDDLFGREHWQAFLDKYRIPREPA